MATQAASANLKNPWVWLTAISALCLTLASSTALYLVTPAVRSQLPWWAAVAAPALVYALVLPLCVPSVRIGGWLAGFFMLAVLHAGIALATASLYAGVGHISFGQALAPALWGFPPALVLAMVGALVLTFPFLGALAPRSVTRRLQAGGSPPRAGTTKEPRQAPEIIPLKDRQAWARASAGAERRSAVPTAVGQASRAQPAIVVAAPTLAEHTSLDTTEADGLGAAPAVEETLETAPEVMAAQPSTSTALGPVDLETSKAVVRIPFDRVVGQLPPGAFRVPLGQVGARLQEAETLLVSQDVVMPQLAGGVVQVEWELVAEQFPAAVYAVAPAEVKERIVNGRLLLPLDEIVRQLSPEVSAVSSERGPEEGPGIESLPATATAPPAPVLAEPEHQPARLDASVLARTMRRDAFPEARMAHHEFRGEVERLAALLTPRETAAPEEVQIGDFAIISVSAWGLAGSEVAAAGGRLSPLIAHRAPRPVEQATFRGAECSLVLTPVGPGWSTGAALAVALRPGGPLARFEVLARRAAAAGDSGSPPAARQPFKPAPSVDFAPPPPAAAAAVEDLGAFGPLTATSYREPMSGALIHCFVSPGTSAAELAPFAWELAQVMAQGAHGEALGTFRSAVLLSGRERLEIRRLGLSTGPAPVLVVAGEDTGRPGLARLQVERAAARLSGP